MAVKMRTTVAVFIISILPWAAFSSDTTTTTNCYTKGLIALQETCSPTQYILTHSVESQEVSNCSDSSPGDMWSRSGPAVYLVWEMCNLQKERCTNMTLDKTSFVRMNYTCVDELSSVRRYDMCSEVSEAKSTPVYLESPGYPRYHNYTKGNCTCNLSVFPTQGSEAIRLRVFDMSTQLPETVTLKWSNGTSKELTTVADSSGRYILNQETTGISSATVVSFVPRYSGQGYFWIGLESEVPVDISITCNGGLGTSPTLGPTTATTTPTSATISFTDKTTTTETATTTTVSSNSSTASTTATTSITHVSSLNPTSKTTITETAAMTTALTNKIAATTAVASTATTSITPAAVMAEDNLKTIYIVVPTVVLAIIIIIVVVVIVKKKRKSNYTKSEDVIRFNVPEFRVESLYGKKNLAMDIVDNGSLSGQVSSYGVGVAFGTFKGEKVHQRSNEELIDIGEEEKERQRGINAPPKFETFGGEDLLLGDPAAGPSGGGDVIYAEVNKPKKNKDSEENQAQGQTSVLRQNPLNEQNGQTVTDIPVEEETAYSLADDFDDPNEYFDNDVGEGSVRATNDAAAPDEDEDYAYAYTRRRGRDTSKRREPQQSIHIYDDVDSDDSEFAESDIDGAYGVAMDVQIEVNGQEDEGTDGETDYDALDLTGQKHKQKIDEIEHVQRTEL